MSVESVKRNCGRWFAGLESRILTQIPQFPLCQIARERRGDITPQFFRNLKVSQLAARWGHPDVDVFLHVSLCSPRRMFGGWRRTSLIFLCSLHPFIPSCPHSLPILNQSIADTDHFAHVAHFHKFTINLTCPPRRSPACSVLKSAPKYISLIVLCFNPSSLESTIRIWCALP